MLRDMNDLKKYTLGAKDGQIGQVTDLYFDDDPRLGPCAVPTPWPNGVLGWLRHLTGYGSLNVLCRSRLGTRAMPLA